MRACPAILIAALLCVTAAEGVVRGPASRSDLVGSVRFPRVGSTLRLSVQDIAGNASRFTCTVYGIYANTLVVRRGRHRPVEPIPFRSIRKLELFNPVLASSGVKGFLVGTTAMFVLHAPRCGECSIRTGMVYSALMGGLPGAFIGTIVGASKREKWTEIPVERLRP